MGTGWLFSINAFSFVAILGSLFLLDKSALYPAPRAKKGGTPVRDGLRYIRRAPNLYTPFIVFTLVATFGFNHNVVFPRMSREIWGSETWFGWVLTTMSIGSLMGSLLTASRPVVTLRWMIANGLVLGLAGIALAFSGEVWLALPLAIPLGLGGAGFVTSMNAITQQECPPDMRGRILALTAVAFLGSYPIGGPITGLIGDYVGLEWSLAYGAVISLAAVSVLVVVGPRQPSGRDPVRGAPNPARIVDPDGPQPQRTPVTLGSWNQVSLAGEDRECESSRMGCLDTTS